MPIRFRRAVCHAFIAAPLSLAPLGAMAEGTVFNSESVAWQPYTQAECMSLGRRSIERSYEVVGVEGTTFDEGGWRLIGEGQDFVISLYCVADDDTPSLYSRTATRVLVTVVVASTDEALGRALRNVVGDCVEGAPCFADQIDKEPALVEWYHGASYFDGSIGDWLSVRCPPAAESALGPVWGTDVYTSDSAICVAALHAGAIGPDGGAVTIELMSGQESYAGSERNGVTSGAFAASERSYRLVPGGG